MIVIISFEKMDTSTNVYSAAIQAHNRMQLTRNDIDCIATIYTLYCTGLVEERMETERLMKETVEGWQEMGGKECRLMW